MPDSAEPRACASTVRMLVTPLSGLKSVVVDLVGSSYMRKPLLVSTGPWMAMLKMALSREPLDVKSPGSSFEMTTPSRRYSLSVESAKTPSTPASTPYGPTPTGSCSTFSPMRQPLGPLPMRRRLRPSRPTTRESVFTPSVALLAAACALVKPGGYL